jgi:hypothetical protein
LRILMIVLLAGIPGGEKQTSSAYRSVRIRTAWDG